MKSPRFVQVSSSTMPDPRWKPEQGRRGAARSAHPCIQVLGLIDDEGNAYVWSEITGLQKLTVDSNSL